MVTHHILTGLYRKKRWPVRRVVSFEHLWYLFLEFSSVLNSLKIQFVFLPYANQFKTKKSTLNIKPRGSYFVLKCFRGASFWIDFNAKRFSCNGIVEMHRESKLDGQQQQKTHPNNRFIKWS